MRQIGLVAMVVAYRETPASTLSSILILITGIALTLGSASADVLTNYHGRDIDSMMKRTMKRSIPSGDISPRAALAFGLPMAALSVEAFRNPLSHRSCIRTACRHTLLAD